MNTAEGGAAHRAWLPQTPGARPASVEGGQPLTASQQLWLAWLAVGGVVPALLRLHAPVFAPFLTPRLVRERIGLSPLAVIFVLLAFDHVFGFVGLLVALPLSAVGLVALRPLEPVYRASRLFRG